MKETETDVLEDQLFHWTYIPLLTCTDALLLVEQQYLLYQVMIDVKKHVALISQRQMPVFTYPDWN